MPTLIPLSRDLRNHIVGSARVQPENLNGVGTPDLHLQSTAYRHELQMFLRHSDRRNDAQSDLAHMRTIPGCLNSRDRTRDHSGMPAVELWAFQETFGVAHVDSDLALRL